MKIQRKPIVLITNTVPQSVLLPLKGLAEVIMGPDDGNLMSREEVLRLAPELTGIINQAELRADNELLDAGQGLKIIANVALGTDNLDLPLLESRRIWATNTPLSFVEPTADCTMALLLTLARRVLEADAFIRAGKWNSFQPGVWDGMGLAEKTLGIVGYGKIGRAVAIRARAFGMKIIFYDPFFSNDPESCSLDSLLAESDIVSLHLPLTSETHHIMDASRFALMKKGALFLNFARGKTMDESALVEALVSGHLAGAGLDVFEHEPIVNPALLTMPNVVLTPHIGGGTCESRQHARLSACQNVAAVLRGEIPPNGVNKPRV